MTEATMNMLSAVDAGVFDKEILLAICFILAACAVATFFKRDIK